MTKMMTITMSMAQSSRAFKVTVSPCIRMESRRMLSMKMRGTTHNLDIMEATVVDDMVAKAFIVIPTILTADV